MSGGANNDIQPRTYRGEYDNKHVHAHLESTVHFERTAYVGLYTQRSKIQVF